MGRGLGSGMLDKMVHGAFLGKRQIGRPLKYNIRTRGKAGYVIYNQTQIYISMNISMTYVLRIILCFH